MPVLKDTKATIAKLSFLRAIHRHARTEEFALTSMEDSPTNVPALSDMRELTVKHLSFLVNQTPVKTGAPALTTWMQLTPVHALHQDTWVMTAKLISHAVVIWPNASLSCLTSAETTPIQKLTAKQTDGILLTLKTTPNII